MAAFFFNFVPGSTNLYINLAERIKHNKWKGSLATLNYERLLEISLVSSGIRPVVGRKAELDNEIELCLPHGCCHLFCDSVKGTAKGISFSGPNVTTSGLVKAIINPNEFSSRIANDAFPPVMSYFDHAKRKQAEQTSLKTKEKDSLNL